MVGVGRCFFICTFLPNFDLKNMIFLTCSKDFSWKKMAQNHQISAKEIPKSSNFYDKFQSVAKSIEGVYFNFFSPYFHISDVAKFG
jgi:hypothetical protein